MDWLDLLAIQEIHRQFDVRDGKHADGRKEGEGGNEAE